MKDYLLPITADKANEVLRRLKLSEQPEDIAKDLRINQLYVHFLEHKWMQEDLLSDAHKPSETISGLLAKESVDDALDDATKAEDDPFDERKMRRMKAAILLRSGVTAPLAAVETKLAIWVVSRVAKEEHKRSTKETRPKGTMPKHALFQCLVLSVFVNHYRNIRKSNECGLADLLESERRAENIRQVIEACVKTTDEIQQSNIIKALDILYPSKNPRDTKRLAQAYLSFEKLFAYACALRRQWTLPRTIRERYARREKFRSSDMFISEELCQECGSTYAYESFLKTAHRHCPFCEIAEQLRTVFNISEDGIQGNN